MLRPIFIFTCLLISSLAHAYSDDQIANEFLGFSEDGKYFAYSTSGKYEGSGDYGFKTFVVETVSGEVVGNADIKGEYETIKKKQLAMWRLENGEATKTLLQKYKIASNNGVQMTVKSTADMTIDLAFNGKKNRFDLKVIEPVYDCSSSCGAVSVCRMLQLTAQPAEYDKTWKYNKGWRYGGEQIVFADQSASKDRQCVDSYKLVRLGATKASGELWAVFIFRYHRAGAEGGDHDFYVVSKKLVNAL